MLNYKHLHYFLAVARAGGVIRAAERLHLTPQTLSGQITQFEDRLGVPLFRRAGRRLELTEAGRLAQSYAEEIFQTGAELEDLLRNGGEERFITFRVGIADVVPKFIAHRLLAPVLELPEAVRLICQEDRLDRLLADLAIHRLDMVLADRPMPPGTDIKGYSHPLGESALAFMAAPALVKRLKGEFPACLDGAPLLLPGRDSALHGALPRWLERQERHMRIVGEFDDSALMKAFGEAGAGVFPAPAASVPDVMAHYKVVSLGRDGRSARAVLPHLGRAASDPPRGAGGQRTRTSGPVRAGDEGDAPHRTLVPGEGARFQLRRSRRPTRAASPVDHRRRAGGGRRATKATLVTPPWCPARAAISCTPLSAPQTRSKPFNVTSAPPESRRRPSGDQATLVTPCPDALRGRRAAAPLSASHTRGEPFNITSAPPESRRRPSGDEGNAHHPEP
jgi:LysR family transcriptional activator of nhaA